MSCVHQYDVRKGASTPRARCQGRGVQRARCKDKGEVLGGGPTLWRQIGTICDSATLPKSKISKKRLWRPSRLLRLHRCLSGDSCRQLPPWCLSLRVTRPRTDSRGRCTPSRISGGSGQLVSPSASPPSTNSIAAETLAGAPRKSASTTPHVRSSSTKSGGAPLTTVRSRPWLRWKRSDW
jgi:hypothetical protein